MENPIQLSLIPHAIEQTIIMQRASDGYVNATAMCKAAKKEWSHYKELVSTKAFIDELSSALGISGDGLIDSIVGGVPQLQGTWVHPQVAIHLAQWLSPKFAVLVSKWVFEWMTGGAKNNIPYHLQRYIANRANIPHTHFSVLNELIFGLIAPMESNGYTLPETMVPDISQGRMFAKWLREIKNMDPNNFPTYTHKYEDGREVQARLYPNELLADFRKHFNEVWLPQRAHGYFKDKDPKALPHLNRVLALNEGFKKKALE